MDLSTRYLGLELDSPLLLGASPLTADLDAVRRAQDAGASAIVMSSLFEEQLRSADAVGYYPADRRQFAFGPAEYLEQIRQLKAALHVPVIASLNGATNGDWLDYAALMDQAGADALELNLYSAPDDFERSGASVEAEALDMVRRVSAGTKIPVSVKLSPFYTSLPSFSEQLVGAGAKGLVLFNRFYQPDVDSLRREVEPRLEYSTSSELLLRLHWLAILSARLDSSLAVTGGVHTSEDAMKAILTGADGVQLVSEILQHGFVRFTKLRLQMCDWLGERGYHSIAQVRDSMNITQAPCAEGYRRTQYLHVLHSYPVIREWGLR